MTLIKLHTQLSKRVEVLQEEIDAAQRKREKKAKVCNINIISSIYTYKECFHNKLYNLNYTATIKPLFLGHICLLNFFHLYNNT